ncbi:MAG: hypothetical protein GY802_03150 [Gammaproteobacteria bacterium]|nr:hypothetical protein [Gammaproteobacteria bacterium]
MSRTLQVIVVIAIVCSLVEICSLAVNYFEPPSFNEASYLANMSERIQLRWQVYWFSGLPIALIGWIGSRRFELLGNALLIGGIYLMLFGNNGGFWSDGYVMPRMVTSFITLSGLLLLIRDQQWRTPT